MNVQSIGLSWSIRYGNDWSMTLKSPDIELIKPDYVNEAFERLEKGDLKYRFVIDMAPLKV